jgi:hypothetical protein
MFGHQDDAITHDQKQEANVALPDSALSALTGDPVVTPPTDNPSPVQSPPAITLDESASPQPEENFATESKFNDAPVDPDFNATTSAAPTHNSRPEKQEHISHSSTNVHPSSKPASVSIHTDNLLDIKNEALHDLIPLVDELDLSFEEKFKTVMMLIQASDNQDLIPQAYNLAKQISDEKLKAQALLDVVNEINYFTQKDTDKD